MQAKPAASTISHPGMASAGCACWLRRNALAAESRRRRNQPFTKQPLSASGKQIEKRRIEIRSMQDCRPGAAEAGQTAKIDGEQFVKPKAFVTRLEKDVGKVNDRNQHNTESCEPVQLEGGRPAIWTADDHDLPSIRAAKDGLPPGSRSSNTGQRRLSFSGARLC
jgi:hypothetical protein